MLMNRLHKQHNDVGSASGILLIFMTLGFVMSSALAVWAFIGAQENQTNLDSKVAAATEVAVQEAESAKEVEFIEREKTPFRSYAGSSTYGSLSFGFPKSWNVYAVESSSRNILDFYAHPGLIPGIGREVNFAFRVQIVDTSYDKEVSKLKSAVEKGTLTAVSYRPTLVSSELGVRLEGELSKDKVGALVLLPQRDKTFKIWTESVDYVADFDKILETLTFIP